MNYWERFQVENFNAKCKFNAARHWCLANFEQVFLNELFKKNYIRKLEIEWKTIRDEGLALMDENQNFPNFDKEAEGLSKKGDWRQFNLWQRGMEEEANCKLVPKTCHMIRAMTEATGCRRGQIKYRFGRC